MTRRIANLKHELYTVKTQKRSLSFWEDKRAWVSINESLPYGHFLLNNNIPQMVIEQEPEQEAIIEMDNYSISSVVVSSEEDSSFMVESPLSPVLYSPPDPGYWRGESDSDDVEEFVAPPEKRRRRNPFILDEAEEE